MRYLLFSEIWLPFWRTAFGVWFSIQFTYCCGILMKNFYFLLNGISRVDWNYLHQDIVSWDEGWVRKVAFDCSSPKENLGVCKHLRPPWCWWRGWATASPSPSRPLEPPTSRSDPRKVRRVLSRVHRGTWEARCYSTGQCLLRQIPCPDRPILVRNIIEMSENVIEMENLSNSRIRGVDHCDDDKDWKRWQWQAPPVFTDCP